MSGIVVAAFYQFTPVPDPEWVCAALAEICVAAGLKGTLLVAGEGVNGTLAGSRAGIEALVVAVRALPGCAGMPVKESGATRMPFARLKVRVKPEIVMMGVPGAGPPGAVGTPVAPEAWNALLRAPDVAVIDTRNAYETAIGSFAGAVDPGTERFRDFPAWWRGNAGRFAGKRVAMFCTGGIRCEKATSFVLGEGAEAVFHLEGGILGYLAAVPAAESLWRGECFVFDGRVSVGADLAPGAYTVCHACGGAVSEAERAAPGYEAGVSCPGCIGVYDESRRAGFRERQRQIALAAGRGERHLGGA